MLRRVKKADVKKDTWVQPDGFDECLACWKAWMHGDGDRDLDAKTMRMLSGEEDSYGVDISEAQQARDTKIAIATDAMIDSLKRVHIWAIYRTCGISTPWNFPLADLTKVFSDSRELLTEKLRKNSCTRVLF